MGQDMWTDQVSPLHGVFAAAASASAALLGLLFVGLSLHVGLVVEHEDVRALARQTFTSFADGVRQGCGTRARRVLARHGAPRRETFIAPEHAEDQLADRCVAWSPSSSHRSWRSSSTISCVVISSRRCAPSARRRSRRVPAWARATWPW